MSTQLALELQLESVPAKRPVDAPPLDAIAELLCPPEDVVLQQHRREKAQIVRVRANIQIGC